MSEKKRSAKEFFMDNNKKNLKIFIAVAVAVLVLAAVIFGVYIFTKVGLINIDKDGKVDPDYTLAPEDEFDDMDEEAAEAEQLLLEMEAEPAEAAEAEESGEKIAARRSALKAAAKESIEPEINVDAD